MADEQDKPSKPRRRWFQFSLRTLLAFTVASSLVLAWVGLEIKQAFRQPITAHDAFVIWAAVAFAPPIVVATSIILAALAAPRGAGKWLICFLALAALPLMAAWVVASGPISSRCQHDVAAEQLLTHG